MATGTLIFSHILPAVLGFFGIILLIAGIMDDEREVTFMGIGLFIIACISPFIILNLIL
ncbi:MAG: hypothetical protein FWE58_06160 [Methanobrevibacter sp.]|nr:hypothetical protein [Methanobrevibacter sp.]